MSVTAINYVGHIQYTDPAILTLLNSFVGMISYYATTTAPAGWLYCDGSTLLRADYPRLFAKIGTTYGSTAGNNFKIPDLRAEFIRGYDNTGGGTNQGVGGKQSWATQRQTGTIALFNNYRGVYGNSASGIYYQVGAGSTTADIADGGGSDGRVYISSDSSRQVQTDLTYNDTRPRNMALLPCIKY